MNQAALGLYPAFNHVGGPLDAERFDLRDLELAEGVCGALCEARMDLEECCNACGFHRWPTIEPPCFCCGCPRDDLYNFPTSMETSNWTPRDSRVYNADVCRALMVRAVSCAVLSRDLIAELRFDGRSDGFAGLCLLFDFPALNLPRGARLLETGPVVNLHDLSNLVVPATLSFFNSCGDHGLHFICPLFNVLGFNID